MALLWVGVSVLIIRPCSGACVDCAWNIPAERTTHARRMAYQL